MKKPDALKWGPRKLRDWADSVVEAIIANCPISGTGTTVDDGDGSGRPVNVTASSTAGSTTGYTGSLTVCEDDGEGGYTQKTATFENGVLTGVA